MLKIPEGITEIKRNGILLPHLDLNLSLNHAINGSVTASNNLPEARIREKIVNKTYLIDQ